MKALVLIGILSLAACQTSQGTFCDIAKPARFSPDQVDQLTDTQVAEVLGHNRRGEKLCGWTP